MGYLSTTEGLSFFSQNAQVAQAISLDETITGSLGVTRASLGERKDECALEA